MKNCQECFGNTYPDTHSRYPCYLPLSPVPSTSCGHTSHFLYYQDNVFTLYALLWKVVLLPQDVGTYEISSINQLYKKEWATLYRLTTSTSQVSFESEQNQKDFVIFLSPNHAKHDFFLASLIEKFPIKVDNILTKDTSWSRRSKTIFKSILGWR
jgi:hypothetical protein